MLLRRFCEALELSRKLLAVLGRVRHWRGLRGWLMVFRSCYSKKLKVLGVAVFLGLNQSPAYVWQRGLWQLCRDRIECPLRVGIFSGGM